MTLQILAKSSHHTSSDPINFYYNAVLCNREDVYFPVMTFEMSHDTAKDRTSESTVDGMRVWAKYNNINNKRMTLDVDFYMGDNHVNYMRMPIVRDADQETWSKKRTYGIEHYFFEEHGNKDDGEDEAFYKCTTKFEGYTYKPVICSRTENGIKKEFGLLNFNGVEQWDTKNALDSDQFYVSGIYRDHDGDLYLDIDFHTIKDGKDEVENYMKIDTDRTIGVKDGSIGKVMDELTFMRVNPFNETESNNIFYECHHPIQ